MNDGGGWGVSGRRHVPCCAAGDFFSLESYKAFYFSPSQPKIKISLHIKRRVSLYKNWNNRLSCVLGCHYEKKMLYLLIYSVRISFFKVEKQMFHPKKQTRNQKQANRRIKSCFWWSLKDNFEIAAESDVHLSVQSVRRDPHQHTRTEMFAADIKV